MSQVASGLCYLHDEARIVHGDIKAENVLITDEGHALLADFGLSTTVTAGPSNTTENVRQRYTLAYCAPEIVDDTAEDPIAPGVKRSKTKMSDVYAYGVLLYQVRWQCHSRDKHLTCRPTPAASEILELLDIG